MTPVRLATEEERRDLAVALCPDPLNPIELDEGLASIAVAAIVDDYNPHMDPPGYRGPVAWVLLTSGPDRSFTLIKGAGGDWHVVVDPDNDLDPATQYLEEDGPGRTFLCGCTMPASYQACPIHAR